MANEEENNKYDEIEILAPIDYQEKPKKEKSEYEQLNNKLNNLKQELEKLKLRIFKDDDVPFELDKSFEAKIIKDLEFAKQQHSDDILRFYQSEEFRQLMQEFLIKIVKEEVRTQAFDSIIHARTDSIIRQYFTENGNDILNLTIKTTINKILEKYSRDIRIASELSQSIDKEIRHTLMKLPISYQTELACMSSIKDTIEKTSNAITKNQKFLESDK